MADDRVHAAWRGAEDAKAVCGVTLWGRRFVVASPSRVTCAECRRVSVGEERTQAEFLGLAEGTASAVVELERAVERFGLAQRQQALGLALWRTTSGHPSFRMTADFIIDQLVMRDGGRDIRVEVRVFPPEGAPYRELGHRQGYGLDELGRPRFVEPKVTWRGSYSDFATDLLELLGPDGVERLCDEALPRARFVRDERGEKT